MKPKILSLEGPALYDLNDIEKFSDAMDIIFEPYNQDQFLKNIENYDGIILDAKIQLNEEALTKASRLKVVSRFGVGYDNVDVEACSRHNVYVSITPVLAEAVSDLTFALLLSLSRSIIHANNYTREEWVKTGKPFQLGRDLHHKILGIIGLGRIGFQVAKRGYAFDMDILYTDKLRNKQAENLFKAKHVTLDELLKKSDYVTIHAPLNKETQRMIGERELHLLKKSAFLVNTSRGTIIDQDSLRKMLNKRRIAGAALDVFEVEPISKDDLLLSLDNVVLTPHIGADTVETCKRMGFTALNNVFQVLEDKTPINLVPEQRDVTF